MSRMLAPFQQPRLFKSRSDAAAEEAPKSPEAFNVMQKKRLQGAYELFMHLCELATPT